MFDGVITILRLPYRLVYRSHLFPPNFVPKLGCDLCMLLDLFKFENAFKSRENDLERRYFQRPFYGYQYVMAKLLLREVTVLFS